MINNNQHKILAQLSTVHSPDDVYQPSHVQQFIEKVTNEIELETLIIGWEEKPALFDALIQNKQKIAGNIYLWYPFLSDFPGFDNSHLTINYKNQRGVGWAGYKGTHVRESFKQACPNNPFVIETSLRQLTRLFNRYGFDGVFIDKIRYPSMVNGTGDFFSCFCPYCQEKAKKDGFDIQRFQKLISNVDFTKTLKITSGNNLFDQLSLSFPELIEFYAFRLRSINQVIKEIYKEIKSQNKGLGADLFSPCIAGLVGQDFRYIASMVDWVKPMIYRFSNGPSSLRHEIPAIINGLSELTGIDFQEAAKIVLPQIAGLENISLAELELLPPLPFIYSEAESAVQLLSGTKTYLGLETVFIKGKLEVQPNNVTEILNIGKKANVDGFVISWDLLQTPMENILQIKKFLDSNQ